MANKRTTVALPLGLAGILGLRFLIGGARAARRDELQGREPADVSFMLAIHAALRRDLERLIEACHGESHGSDVTRGWTLLRNQLENHHVAEDDDLWPTLRSRLSTAEDLGVVDAMYREHQAISERLRAVDESVGSDRAPATAEQLSHVVLEHLDHEERAVLPLVVSHLSNREWHDYLHLERDKRRGREGAVFLMWVLDNAAPKDAQAVLRELPAGGRFVYRHVLRRLHERRRLWGRSKLLTPYQPSVAQKLANMVLGALARHGRGPRFISLLTVRGRITGETLTTPIVPVDHDDQRWIVAPFGEVSWVRNARAAGRVELGRGHDRHTYTINELDPRQAAPVLRQYLSMPTARYVKDYFDVTTASTDEAIAAEAPRHPVFA